MSSAVRQHHVCPGAVHHPGKGWKAPACSTCEPTPAPQAPLFTDLPAAAFYTEGKTAPLFAPEDPSGTLALFDALEG